MFYYFLLCLKLLEKYPSVFFELELAHYLSTAGYSRYLMLRFTDVDLKLISDIAKCEFIESTKKVVFLWFVKAMLKLPISS